MPVVTYGIWNLLSDLDTLYGRIQNPDQNDERRYNHLKDYLKGMEHGSQTWATGRDQMAGRSSNSGCGDADL
jgi:hypothetical protein